MSNLRARGKKKADWNYEVYGCFGQFCCEGTLPIEYITTTMTMAELSKLSYAKDIRTKLDFELMIQRDIDKKRAVEEISNYISPENGSGYGSIENNGIFLPPLVAAIVDTVDGKELSTAYPNVIPLKENDEYGCVYSREWPGVFKVNLFEHQKGAEYSFDNGADKELVKVDLKNAQIKFNIGSDKEQGARLVVIDGQHRLFALNYLRHHDEHKNKINNLIIPVCILYSPSSTEDNVKQTTPSIPDVLRKLFVDVNNNAKTVSGHFKILLSEDDIGKLVCSSLCSKLLDTADGKGLNSLTLLEWNTKTDKESKTISKPYSLSSIGVIYDTLADLFKTKNGKKVLEHILKLEEISDVLDFGVDSEGDSKPPSSDFPWRDIPYNNKDDMKAQVSAHLTPCVYKLFFETSFYSDFVKIFSETRTSYLENLTKERSTESLTAQTVIEHLDLFTDLKDKSSQQLFSAFIDEFSSRIKTKIPSIVRTNVFQKGLLEAWFSFLSNMTKYKLEPIDLTDVFILTVEDSVNSGIFNNGIENLFLQDSVFDGVKIKPNKESRKQISRLILSSFGKHKVLEEIVNKLKIVVPDSDFTSMGEFISKFGQSNAVLYANSLHSQRIKSFAKGYKSNFALTSSEIQILTRYEEEKEATKKAKRSNSSIEIDQNFDVEVKKHINVDYSQSIEQLSNYLGYSSFFDELQMEDFVEE